ncbi:MAG: rRNA processing protein RimM [Sphingomonadales bacterium]|nr:rRNA processing protein RimM [Sphingomonadales bacterium]
MAEDQVALAAVAGAHGIGGEVRLKLFADGVDSLRRHKQVRAGDRILTLLSVRDSKQPIARFADVVDRAAAEALRGTLLTVPRSALPPLAADEYYHADLIGLACVSAGGTPLGVVMAVENFGAGDLLEIEKPDGRSAMLPFRPGIADLVDGRIVADAEFLA